MTLPHKQIILPPLHLGGVSSKFRTLAEDIIFSKSVALEFHQNFLFSAIRNKHVTTSVMGIQLRVCGC